MRQISIVCILAVARPIGNLWIGAYGSVYEERTRDILGVPQEKRLLCLISLGYPGESPTKDRKSLSEIVCYDKYERRC